MIHIETGHEPMLGGPAADCRSRRLVLAVLLTIAGVMLCVPGLALADLPEGRAYEQVSPEYKAGYGVFGLNDAFALGGETAYFTSLGGFSGSGEDFGLNPYVARRTATGWTTSGLFPSASETCATGLEDMSTELSRFALKVAVGETQTKCEKSATESVWVREPDGSLTQISPVTTTPSGQENGLTVVGGSSDLSRLVIEQNDFSSRHLIPSDETVIGHQLFETEGASVLRLVALNNAGKQLTHYCDVELGNERGAGGNTGAFGAVSQPAGSEVFFSVPINDKEGCVTDASHLQLFVRVNGSSTVEVSKPVSEACSEVPCPGAASRASAVFQGASEDGSRVFFTTTQSLVGEDEDSANDLYMATIGCAGGGVGEACGSALREVVSLTQVSHDPSVGQAAEVEPGMTAISRDGSHVYFVARGVLSQNANGEGETARQGAENLYVWDGSSSPGTVSFIADLCSGGEHSGSLNDARCPSGSDQGLWVPGGIHEAQTTADGRFLVFVTYVRLIGSGPERDSDSAKDVYLYDASTGGLRRVSVGEAGLDGNGNNSLFGANIANIEFRGALQEQYELSTRAVSDDGSTVVFTSAEPMSSATNGQQNVYVWHEGVVRLISSGSSTEPDIQPVVTPSGRDVFFLTSSGLVPGDTDGLRDIYDARKEGGFPAPEVVREPCSGDACQGVLSTPAPLLVPGSVSQAAGGNFSTPVLAKKKAKVKVRKSGKRKRKGKGRRARRSMRVTVNGRRGR
jgi:hypothetical protein